MNWLDFVLIGIPVLAAFAGMRIGLIRAAFPSIGILIGVLLAGQLSDDVGTWFDSYLSSNTLVTVIAYALIIVVAVVVATIAAIVARKMVSMLFLGFVDRLGGLAVGLVAGAAISGAAIIGMAQLTYNSGIPEEGLAAVVLEGRAPQVVDAKHKLEDALTGSALVPIFIGVTDALPADALGFVPSDFRVALNTLQKRIDGLGADSSS